MANLVRQAAAGPWAQCRADAWPKASIPGQCSAVSLSGWTWVKMIRPSLQKNLETRKCRPRRDVNCVNTLRSSPWPPFSRPAALAMCRRICPLFRCFLSPAFCSSSNLESRQIPPASANKRAPRWMRNNWMHSAMVFGFGLTWSQPKLEFSLLALSARRLELFVGWEGRYARPSRLASYLMASFASFQSWRRRREGGKRGLRVLVCEVARTPWRDIGCATT
jgi:hypothetical protein